MNGTSIKNVFDNSNMVIFTVNGETYRLSKDKKNHGALTPTHGTGYTQYFTTTEDAIAFDGCDTFRFSDMEIRMVA